MIIQIFELVFRFWKLSFIENLSRKPLIFYRFFFFSKLFPNDLSDKYINQREPSISQLYGLFEYVGACVASISIGPISSNRWEQQKLPEPWLRSNLYLRELVPLLSLPDTHVLLFTQSRSKKSYLDIIRHILFIFIFLIPNYIIFPHQLFFSAV